MVRARSFHLVLLISLPLVGASQAADDVLRPASLTPRQRQYIQKQILPKLASADFDQRHHGLLEITELGQTAVPFLLDLLKTESDPVPRRMALLALGRIEDPAGRVGVLKCLRDGNANQDELVAACVAAGILGGAECVKELRGLLDERAPSLVRRAAALALARLNDREAVPLLLRLASREPIDFVRAAFDLALGLLGDEAAYKHLCQEAAKDNALVRRAALLALANLPRGELAKDDPLARPEGELRRRDEQVELASLAALAPKTAPLAVSLARQPEKARDRQEDLLFAAAFGRGEGAAALLEDSWQRAKAAGLLPAVLLAGAEIVDRERLRSFVAKALEASEPLVRQAAILTLFASKMPLDQELVDKLSVPDADAGTRRAALLLLATSGVVGLTDRMKKNNWSADERALAEAITGGKKDGRLAVDELEAQLFEMRGRFGYRLAARRDRVVLAALELDRLVRREDSGRGLDGAGDGGTPKPGGSDGSKNPGGGDGGAGGGNSGNSGSGGSGGSGGTGGTGSGGETPPPSNDTGGANQPDSRSGFRRRAIVQNERIEHDLRLFLGDFEYFPRFWTGVAGRGARQ
jgi:HEAT repeat protein